jgi:hypothetical protein
MKFVTAAPSKGSPHSFDVGQEVSINLSRVCQAYRITGDVVNLVYGNCRLNVNVWWKWEDVSL